MKTVYKFLLLWALSTIVCVFAVDWCFFSGSGFPPPHLKVKDLFTPTMKSSSGRAGQTACRGRPSSGGTTSAGTGDALCGGGGDGVDFALLINGGICPGKNHPRYWNNISLVYCTLRYLGFSRIYVLSSDGLSEEADRSTRAFLGLVNTGSLENSSVDMDLDGDIDVNGPATKDELGKTLRRIGCTMKPLDRLFVFITDHGQLRFEGNRLRSVAMLWGGGELYGRDFERMINETVPESCWVTLLACQCHSGIFADEIQRNNTVLMAAGRPLWIWSDQDYSVFPYHFCAALLGRDPATGEKREKARCFRDALRLARKNDHAPEWPALFVRGNPLEIPPPY